MGINVPRYKLYVFILTAVMASLAGSIFCFYLRFTQPGCVRFPLLVELITMIIIGGARPLYGPCRRVRHHLAARGHTHVPQGPAPRMTAEVDAIFFGILIIVILIFIRGLGRLGEPAWACFEEGVWQSRQG